MVVRVMVAVHPGHDLLNLPRAVSRCIAGVHTGVENGAVDHQKDRPAPKQDPFIPWGPHSGYRFRLSAHVRADGQENLPEQQESACQHKHQLQAGMQLLKGTAAAPEEQAVVCQRNRKGQHRSANTCPNSFPARRQSTTVPLGPCPDAKQRRQQIGNHIAVRPGGKQAPVADTDKCRCPPNSFFPYLHFYSPIQRANILKYLLLLYVRSLHNARSI